MMTSPVAFFPYQVAWAGDKRRYKIACKSRQIGLTFAECEDIVETLLARRNQRWYFLSISEDRAAEAVEYAAKFCQAINIAVTTEHGEMLFENKAFKHCTVTFPTGSKLIGLPANERTARGASGHLTLDEFAHQMHDEAIWTAVNAYQMWGYKLHIISTPAGRRGEFYRIWTRDGQHDPDVMSRELGEGRDPVGDIWSRHWIDIHIAKSQGHPVDLEATREIAGTEENWAQEYCCEFLDESTAWIPYSMIEACTDEYRHTHWEDKPYRHLYAGFDVGRKRDLSVLWVIENQDKLLVTRAVITLRNKPFSEQRDLLFAWLKRVNTLHIDQTGIGAQLAEECMERYPDRAEGVTFTNKRNAMMAALVRGKMEQGRVRLPNDADIRRDLHSIRRTYTDAGNVRFEAPRTKDGHADRFWALGLAIGASEQASGRFEYHSVEPRSRQQTRDDLRDGTGLLRDWDDGIG